MEKIHIHTITIEYSGQSVSFRIFLPRDVYKVTGVQVTDNTSHPATGLNSFDAKSQVYQSAVKVGKLYLRRRGIVGTFYSADVIRNDHSLLYGDFDELNFYQTPDATLEDFYFHDWFLAGSKWEAFSVDVVPASCLLLGFYKDIFIQNLGLENQTYQVSIYLKYQTNPCARN